MKLTNANLTKKQMEVLELFYEKNMTLEQIAEKLKISKTSVQDRLDGAIRKFKKHMSR